MLSCVARSEGNFLNERKPELGYIYMDGQEVFKFAVKKVPECIRQVLEESKTDIEEVKYFVLHQPITDLRGSGKAFKAASG